MVRSEKEEEYYPAPEQGIMPRRSLQLREEDILTGESDYDIYQHLGREVLNADDEIKLWEEGFMDGASGAGQLGKDALTGEPLVKRETIVELSVGGKLYRFASDKNAQRYKEKIKSRRKI